MATGELWNERVMLYYVEKKPGAWANPDNVMSTIIDETQGAIFEVSWADLNMDGEDYSSS